MLKSNYHLINLNAEYFSSHRIIWKLVTGNDPKDMIDHINCIRNDNRWSNLREADNSKNQCNKNLQICNSFAERGIKRTGMMFHS